MLANMATVATGTLASRVLGMARDMATVSLLGLSSGVLDALIVAFRIPNLFRGLFGEGALATCYVPHLARQLKQGRESAWETATALAAWLSALLAAVVLLGLAVCGAIWLVVDDPATQYMLSMTAMLLPYLFFVCLAAQVSATLQTLGRFAWPAFATNLLNIVWLAVAWLIAPRASDDPQTRALVLAASILVAGALQLFVQLPALWQIGFRWRFRASAGRETLAEIGPALGPTLLSLAVTRINTFCNSVFAWCLAGTGAAGAVYCAERLCHLPIGLVGVTVATVVFPRLSRHVAGSDDAALGEDLIYGLRWVALIAIPASFGLWLLAEPLTALVFQRGEFTLENVLRTARVVRGYSLGVWASCAAPVLLRAYYAQSDRRMPLVIGLMIVAINLAANLLLVRPLGEVALAVSTSGCAALQCVLLLAGLVGKCGRADWSGLGVSALRATAGSVAMMLAGWVVLHGINGSPGAGHLVQVATTLPTALIVYAALIWPMERVWLTGQGHESRTAGTVAINGPRGAAQSSGVRGM